MNDKKIQCLDDIRLFLVGSAAMEFAIIIKTECGLVPRYLERVSGYSR